MIKRTWTLCACTVLVAAGVVVGTVVAQDGADGGDNQAGAGQMPAWMQSTAQHESLKKSAGAWTAQCKFWMAPGAPPQEFSGSAEAEVILKGRFLSQAFSAQMMGMPFEGRMTLGYDTLAKEYVSTWIDNMSPYFFVYRGKEKDGVINLVGMDPDMMTGKLMKVRHEISWVDDDHYTVAMFKTGADGTEYKEGEIAYARVKK